MTLTINNTTSIPAAACHKCGGWTAFGGMSQHATSKERVMDRTGCGCNTIETLDIGGELYRKVEDSNTLHGFRVQQVEGGEWTNVRTQRMVDGVWVDSVGTQDTRQQEIWDALLIAHDEWMRDG